MSDMQDWEITASLHGGQCGAEYLESINKFDLSQLSPDEWQTFLTTVTANYHSKYRELEPCPF